MRYIEGQSRNQAILSPEVIDDYIKEDNPVKFIDIFEELEEKGHKPDALYADAGYSSGENIIEAEGHEVKLMAP